MTRCRNAKRRTSKKKEYYRSHKTANRSKDIDQIQDEIKKVSETGVNITFEIDDDLPGLGQHYCVSCARHFADQQTLLAHEGNSYNHYYYHYIIIIIIIIFSSIKNT